MSSYYNKCETCGANLDPGEHCDCEDVKARLVRSIFEMPAKNKPVAIKRNDAQQSA